MLASFRRIVVFLLAVVTIASVTAAQPSSPAVVVDPFGRETPRGTIVGFTFAAHGGDYESATRYLQLTDAQRADGPSLARQLESLINRYYTLRLNSMSPSREGNVRDGLPPDRERMSLTIGSQTVDFLLVRVDGGDDGPIWLFSSESLARMSSFRDLGDETWVEHLMPDPLSRHAVLGLSLAQWALWILSFGVPFLVLLIAGAIGLRIAKRKAAQTAVAEPRYAGLRWPATLVITILVHLLVMPWLGVPFTVRLVYTRVLFAILVVVLAWFVWRLAELSFDRARRMALRRHQAGVASLMMLVERVAKAAVVLIVVIGLLRVAGLDMTTALAGVGLGGIAIALGAQKSVENLLGGVFLLADGAIAVGDFCSISNRSGWVEDITLRSVRLRTVEQTLVSIPAGMLAQTTIENFVTRGKMLIQATLPLQYGASSAQVQAVLNGVARLLAGDSDLEAATSRIQLVNLGPAAIELELYAYVRTADNSTFMRVRQRLLLEVFSIVETAGARFARPTEIVLASGGGSRAAAEH